MRWFLLICIVIIWICGTQGARILGIFHVPSYSHFIMGSTLMKELALKGHEVTVISPFPQKSSQKFYRDVELTEMLDAFEGHRKELFDSPETFIVLKQFFYGLITLKLTENVLKAESVQKLLKSKDQFDLIVLDEFGDHALKGFSYHYNAPCIMFNSLGPSRRINPQLGNVVLPSCAPEIYLDYTSNMNFFQRVHNSFTYLSGELLEHLYFIPQHNRMLQKYFPGAPHLHELYYNVSLAFLNSHVSVQQPVPHVPNMIDVGGIHVRPPKPLELNLQQYLDNSTNGVIYFSMGSNLKSSEMPVKKREEVLKVFAKLKQNVLWKWEDEDLPGKPSNVKIGRWLPQGDILAHPNIKLFITHGGLLSTIEAVYHGVPIVGIPIFGDQQMNLANIVNSGLGVGVSYSELTEESLFSAVHEVLTNPKYLENIKRRSNIMHDQPMKPLDKAVFWVEYVLRHHGAPHLKVAALNLNWYQYLLLDVLVFVFGTISTTVAILHFVIRKIYFNIKSKKANKKKKKN